MYILKNYLKYSKELWAIFHNLIILNEMNCKPKKQSKLKKSKVVKLFSK